MVTMSNSGREQARQVSDDAAAHVVTAVSSTTAVPSGARYVRCTQVDSVDAHDIYINFGATATVKGSDTTVLSRVNREGVLLHVPSSATTLAAIGTGAVNMFLEFFS